ncbi:MAG: hypothetical protein K2O54_06375, partial [Prevotella sp.]|nr:hypothetical protein [Prevotella sp.]
PCHHHIYTYSYENAYHNKYHQYVPSVLRFLDIHIRGVVELLACVGLLGKGPIYLPANCITTGLDETGEEYYSDKRNFSYGLNSDGSIYYSSLDYFLGYHFEYEYLNNVDRAAVATW